MFCIPYFSPGAEAKPMSDYVHSEWWFNSQSQADREAIQNDLIWTGDYSQILDGIFGNSTFAAIKAYQTRNGLYSYRVMKTTAFGEAWANCAFIAASSSVHLITKIRIKK